MKSVSRSIIRDDSFSDLSNLHHRWDKNLSITRCTSVMQISFGSSAKKRRDYAISFLFECFFFSLSFDAIWAPRERRFERIRNFSALFIFIPLLAMKNRVSLFYDVITSRFAKAREPLYKFHQLFHPRLQQLSMLTMGRVNRDRYQRLTLENASTWDNKAFLWKLFQQHLNFYLYKQWCFNNSIGAVFRKMIHFFIDFRKGILEFIHSQEN